LQGTSLATIDDKPDETLEKAQSRLADIFAARLAEDLLAEMASWQSS